MWEVSVISFAFGRLDKNPFRLRPAINEVIFVKNRTISTKYYFRLKGIDWLKIRESVSFSVLKVSEIRGLSVTEIRKLWRGKGILFNNNDGVVLKHRNAYDCAEIVFLLLLLAISMCLWKYFVILKPCDYVSRTDWVSTTARAWGWSFGPRGEGEESRRETERVHCEWKSAFISRWEGFRHCWCLLFSQPKWFSLVFCLLEYSLWLK